MSSILLQIIFSGLTIGSIYAIFGIGISLIYKTSGIINFAHGPFAILSVFCAYKITLGLGLGLGITVIWSVLGAVIIGACCGALIERFVINPIRIVAKNISNLILSLVMIAASMAVETIIMLIWGKQPISIPTFSAIQTIKIFGAVMQTQSLWIIGALALVLGLLYIFFKNSLYGKALIASAEKPDTAVLMGINSRRMVLFSFSIGVSLAALGGILVAPITDISFAYGSYLTIKGLIAAIFGGIDNVFGVVLGGIMIGLIEMLVSGFVSSLYKDPITFIIVIGILVIRGGGIFGEQEARV